MNFVESVKQKYDRSLSAARSGAEKSFRERAWSEFQRQGLPDRKNEAWKYSNLTSISQAEWSDAGAGEPISSQVQALLQACKVDFEIAVLTNGEFDKKNSVLTLESGYEFQAGSAPTEFAFGDGFISLAAAVSRGGYTLRVAPGVVYPKPLLIVHNSSGRKNWSSTLNRVVLGEGAEFQLCEIFVGDAEEYLRTDLTAVEMEENARFSWARVQSESAGASHFSDAQVRLRKNSTLNFTQLNSGAAWARASLNAELLGENAEARVNGLTFARGEQHIDQRVQVRHLAPLTNSSQLFKGVLKDRARGILNGKIYIAAGAQKVNSSQLNHNLLLSSTAEADTKPELEIFADDVKANHGASVGRLDEDKLFYLLSRGIPHAQAVSMLARAFVSDVLMKIPSRVQQNWLANQVEGTLPEFAAQMESLK